MRKLFGRTPRERRGFVRDLAWLTATLVTVACGDESEEARVIPEFSRPFDADEVPELWGEIAAIEEMSIRVRSLGSHESEVQPGVRFRVDILGDRVRSVRASIGGVTGAKGIASVPITPWVRKERDHLVWPRVSVRVMEPGFQEREYRAMSGTEDLAVREIEIRARPGRTLQGRLIARGHGRVHGEWSAWTQGLEPVRLGLGTLGTRGSSDMHIAATEAPFWIHATSRGYGTGVLRDLKLDSPYEDPIVLAAEGGHRLRGRLVDTEGRPILKAEVRAVAQGIDLLERSGSPGEAEALEFDRMKQGSGHLRTIVDVGRGGIFEFTGLREGDYALDAALPRGPIRWTRLSEDAVAAVNSELPTDADGGIRTYAIRRPRLRVQLTDAGGRVLEVPVQCLPQAQRHPRGVPRPGPSWPRKLCVAVCEDWDENLVGVPEQTFLPGWGAGLGCVFVEVARGVTYRVGLVGPGIRWRPIRVTTPIDGSQVDLTLVVPDSVPTGRLVLSTQDSAGHGIRSGQLRIRIADPDSGIPLVESHVPPSAGSQLPMTMDLPEGNWFLQVDAQSLIEDYHGTLVGDRMHGGFATTIHVDGGEETTVLAQLDAGARIELRAEGVESGGYGAVASRGNRRWRFPGIHDTPRMRWAHSGSVFVALRAPGRWPELLVTRAHGGIYGGTALTHWGHPDGVTLFELVPAGEYQLEAWTTDGRIVTQPVSLFEGETTRVTVSFP